MRGHILRLLALLLLCSGWILANEKPKTYTVHIRSMSYEPSVVVAAKGDEIVWTNSDIVPHTVTATNKSFDSGPIKPGATWRLKVTWAGPVGYRCTFHPTMTGTLKTR